jgi:hypothetical protein
VVRAVGDPAGTENQSLDLFFRKHQLRQHEAGLQDIADSGFAVDMRALRLQRGDVAIKGADADSQVCGQYLPADWALVAAQQLNQVKQACGSGHGSPEAISHAVINWQHCECKSGVRSSRPLFIRPVMTGGGLTALRFTATSGKSIGPKNDAQSDLRDDRLQDRVTLPNGIGRPIWSLRFETRKS